MSWFTNMFSDVEGAFKAAIHEIVKVDAAVNTELPKIENTASEVETVTGFVLPSAVPIEEVAYGLLAQAAKVAVDLGPAAAANGLSLTLDKSVGADLLALGTYAKAHPFVRAASKTAPVSVAQLSPAK